MSSEKNQSSDVQKYLHLINNKSDLSDKELVSLARKFWFAPFLLNFNELTKLGKENWGILSTKVPMYSRSHAIKVIFKHTRSRSTQDISHKFDEDISHKSDEELGLIIDKLAKPFGHETRACVVDTNIIVSCISAPLMFGGYPN